MLSEYDNGDDGGGDVCIALGWLGSIIYAKHLDFYSITYILLQM